MTKETYKAAREADRVYKLSAFNVSGYVKREKLNQHAVLYHFDDNSRLQVSTRKIIAWHMDWKGTHDDTGLRPVHLPSKVPASPQERE